jgi:alpha-ketoglutarate-dependent taurine dioxygenase
MLQAGATINSVTNPELCHTTLKAYHLGLMLEAGDVIVFDNTRLLHARTAFTVGAGKTRWLQGCYIDIDSMSNNLRIGRHHGL